MRSGHLLGGRGSKNVVAKFTTRQGLYVLAGVLVALIAVLLLFVLGYVSAGHLD
jgi:hypothetical protein